MLSSRTSRWVAGTCAACLVVATASWFLLISPRRSHAAQLRDQSQSVASANDTLRLQIAQLKAEFADLPSQKAELVTVQQQLPPTAAMPALVRSLNGIADSTGVNLNGITPGAAANVSTSTTANGGTGTTGASGSGAASGSLVALPVSVAVTGDYFAATLFMKQLQTKLRRAFLVTGIAVSPNTSTSVSSDSTTSSSSSSGNAASGNISLTITGEVFVLQTGKAGGSTGAAASAGTSAGTTGTTAGTTSSSTSGTTSGSTSGTTGAAIR